MADMTSTTMANWTFQVYSKLPTITYRSNTVSVMFLDRRWEPELGIGAGDRVLIPGFTQNNLAKNRGAGTGTFGTGAAVTFDAVTESQVSLRVNRFYYKADRQPFEALAQATPEYLTYLLQGRGKAIALQVDSDVNSDATDGFASFTTSEGTDNVDLTEDVMLAAETDLNNQIAPETDRFMVVSPASRGSIIKIEAVRNSLFSTAIGNLSGSQGLGRIGHTYTWEVYQSANLASGTNGKKNAAMHREAVAYAEQLKMQTETTTNIQDGGFRQHITYMTVGFKKVKDLFGVLMPGK